MAESGSIIYNWIFPRGWCSLSAFAKASRRARNSSLPVCLCPPPPSLCNNWKALILKYNTATSVPDLIPRPLWFNPQLDTFTRAKLFTNFPFLVGEIGKRFKFFFKQTLYSKMTFALILDGMERRRLRSGHDVNKCGACTYCKVPQPRAYVYKSASVLCLSGCGRHKMDSCGWCHAILLIEIRLFQRNICHTKKLANKDIKEHIKQCFRRRIVWGIWTPAGHL